MRIKIISCTDSQMWYFRKEGQVFKVIDHDLTEYLVRTGTGECNIVLNKDAEIIDELTKN